MNYKTISTLLEKKWVVFVLLFLITLPTLLPLFNPGYFSTQDYIYVARIQQMREALGAGQFPVRWVQDFRYGEPLYNFYAPLPYYFGALIKIAADTLMIPLSYLVLTKMLFLLGFFVSVLAMYFLGKRLFGTLGGIAAATLYLYAPYHSVDLYVRGALSEAYALIIFPLIFLAIMRFAESRSVKWFVLSVLAMSGLFYTHNIMTVLFSPFILMWMGYWTLKKGRHLFLPFGGAFILAALSACSYLLPAFFEKNLVQSTGLTSGYFDFRGHFISIKQWFYSPWGYGASLWGEDDDMSFMLGFTHWFSFFGSGVLLLIILLSKYVKGLTGVLEQEVYEGKKKYWLIFSSSIIGFGLLFSLFMTHVRSAFIWEQISLLAFTQFPWRFLGVSIFFGSLFGGLFIYLLKEKFQLFVTILLVVATIVLNIGYFRPDVYYYDATDYGYIDDVFNREERVPRDYVPKTTIDVQRPHLESPEFKYGNGLISNFKYRITEASFTVYSASESAIIEVPVTYFPGWTIKSPQEAQLVNPDKYGLVTVQLFKPGTSEVLLRFEDTPIRTAGNAISGFAFLSIVLLSAFGIWKKKRAKSL